MSEIRRSENARDANELESSLNSFEYETDKDFSDELDESYESFLKGSSLNGLYRDSEGLDKQDKPMIEKEDELTGVNLDAELDRIYESYIEEDKLAKIGEVSDLSNANSNSDINDNLASSLDEKYNDVSTDQNKEGIRKETVDNNENVIEKIKCRNEGFESQNHSVTDVPFIKKEIDLDGVKYEVVVPEFQSLFDVVLPESMYDETDRKQFKECNKQLRDYIAEDKEFRELFDDDQIEQIEDCETPDDWTWHHDAEPGNMQLVSTETHQKTGHTGGRTIWGGGNENR